VYYQANKKSVVHEKRVDRPLRNEALEKKLN